MEKYLQNIGLSPNESKIYLILVKKGELSVSEISTATNIHRRNIYDTMDRLIEKGLVFLRSTETENKYNPVDPIKLVEIISEKKEGIEKILPSLQKHYQNQTKTDQVYILKGLEGQKNIWKLVIENGSNSYFIGAKANWFDDQLNIARAKFFEQAKAKKIKFIQLFDYQTSLNQINFPKHFPGKLEYRILPEEYNTESAIHIFGDYVISYTGLEIGNLSNDVTFFVMKSTKLSASYITWFKFMWQNCGPS